MRWTLWALVLVGVLPGLQASATNLPSENALQTLLSRWGEADKFPRFMTAKADQPLQDLGRELFFSKALSGNMDVACASCHHPLLAGADGLSLAVGEHPQQADLIGPGRRHSWRESSDPKARGGPNVPRNSQTTFNVGLYSQSLFFDGRIFVDTSRSSPDRQAIRTPDSNLWQPDTRAGETLLTAQAVFPLVSLQEMLGYQFASQANHQQVRQALVDRLWEQRPSTAPDSWHALFKRAYPQSAATVQELFTVDHVQQALAAYQDSQRLVDSPWQAYLRGKSEALSPMQKRGAWLFYTPGAKGGGNCNSCHSGAHFTDEKFHNLAIPQFGRGKLGNQGDLGRWHVTLKSEDKYRFRTPSLLNVALTAPYGHTGAYPTLEQIIRHHLDPRAAIDNFDFNFADNPQLAPFASLYKNAEVRTREALAAMHNAQGTDPVARYGQLSDDDILAVVAFLHALTDPCARDLACLQQWLPPSSPAPDKHRLQARFATWQDDTSAPPDTTEHPMLLTQQQALMQANGSADHSCAPGTQTANQKDRYFEEIALSTGLDSRHQLSWSLYTLDAAQRVLFTGGLAMGDLNNDCWPDLYHPNGDVQADKLFINQRDGSFSNQSAEWGIKGTEFSNGASMADIDGDGYLDLLVTNIMHPHIPSIMGQAYGERFRHAPTLYQNQQGKHFKLWPKPAIKASFTSWSAAFADYDQDGDLDILTTHWRGPGVGGAQPNHLWQNQGEAAQWAFTPVDEAAGLLDMVGNTDFTFSGIFADINHDRQPDILMAADFASSQVYLNSGQQRFVRNTAQHQIRDENAMGADVIDIDNDGDLDWFVSSIWDPDGVAEGTWGITGNKLYLSDHGRFVDVSAQAGVAEGYWGWGVCLADFNNDGRADIFHTSGSDIVPQMSDALGGPHAYGSLKRALAEFQQTPSRLYIANGDGSFTERAESWGINDRLSGRAVVCSDYDRDGDVDIFIANHQGPLLLYKNHSRAKPATHFVNIRLRGAPPNTQGIGARVYVSANGVTQMQEVRAGGTFLSSAPSNLHFGLGDAALIDRIRVLWPQQGEQELLNIPANQFITIDFAAVK